MLLALVIALSTSMVPADACGDVRPEVDALTLAEADLVDAQRVLAAAQAQVAAATAGDALAAAEQAVWEAELGLEQARRVAAMLAGGAS